MCNKHSKQQYCSPVYCVTTLHTLSELAKKIDTLKFYDHYFSASTGGKGEVAVPTDQVDMSPGTIFVAFKHYYGTLLYLAKKKPKKGSVKSPKKNSPKRVKKPPSKEKVSVHIVLGLGGGGHVKVFYVAGPAKCKYCF